MAAALALLALLAACSVMAPPSATPDTRPSPTSAEPTSSDVPTTRLFLAGSEKEPGTGDATLDLVAERTAPGATVRVAAPQGEFEELVRWQIDVGDAVDGAAFATSVEVTSVGSDVEFRWRVQRVDECNVVVDSSEYTARETAAGVHTADLELETAWRPGDRLRMSFEARTVNDRAPGHVEIGLHASDSHVETQLAQEPPTEDQVGPPDVGEIPAKIPPGRLRNVHSPSDPIVTTDTTGLSAREFRWNNQRNFWWNGHQGRWDGVLPTSSPPASGTSQWWLWKDLGGAPEAVDEISTRTANTPDTFWDETCRRLFVFLSRDAFGTSRFQRYVYDAATDTYIEHTVGSGVAAPASLRGSKRVSITVSPKGHVWAAVNHGNRLLVSRSTDEGDTWPEPVEISATAANGDTHWVVFEQQGVTRLGVAATEDGAVGGARVRFLSIDQDEAAWRDPGSWVDETASIPGDEGDERADDELSAIAHRNVVYIVGETEPAGTARSSGAPQLVVHRRTPDGAWSKHVLHRFTATGGEDRKRPVITVNQETGHVLVGVGRNDGTRATLYRAPIADLDSWEEHVIFAGTGARSAVVGNVRLPRFPVDETQGVLALAEEASGAVWRQLVFTEPPPGALCPPRGGTVCGW